MLRKTRIAIAALFLAGITLLFLGLGDNVFGWMAKLQFLPSVLRLIGSFTLLNLGIVALILALTLLFGRVYCSVVCPLGIFQDLALWLRNRLGKRSRNEKKFKFSPSRGWLRCSILAFTIVGVIGGLQSFIVLIAPYSMYGRIVRSFASIGGRNPVPVLLAVGLGSFVLIAVLAAAFGRVWCSNICPVGTFLGLFSRFSLFRPRIDSSKCVSCGMCEKKCRASCIDASSGTIDSSRCVDCFDCIGTCHTGAISYSAGKPRSSETVDEPSGTSVSRRDFLATGAALLASGVAANAQVQGGLAELEDKTEPSRTELLVPPGAWSVKSFYDKCTACQLCVTVCENKVLRPSKDIEHLLQPRMGFDSGWCRPECTACSSVCPTGAIKPITRDAKAAVKIGAAVVNPELCISCGHCARRCPTGALVMTEIAGVRIPVVAEEVCVGCGACEYLCPVRPLSAITVNGIPKHVEK